MKGLQGQVAVVVGAGRGIGRAIAEAFAAYGAKVVVGSRTKSEVDAVVAYIRDAGGTAEGWSVDVRDRKSVQDFVSKSITAFGRIDSMVYCAGVNRRVPAAEYPEEEWIRVLDTNLAGAYRTCQEVGKHMIAQGGGAIVNITSMMSHVTTPNQGAYAASKGGLLQYTKVLAVEWAKYNIRVNAVSPGYILTEMTSDVMGQDTFRNNVLAKTPQGRLGRPDEIAQAVCFLASPEASFINGIALPVDGGFLAGHPAIAPQA